MNLFEIRLSFVIPCRNEENYIVNTITSILKQKDIGNNFEIIIVDGMSDDGTRNLVIDLQKSDNRIKLIDNKKQITPIALNIGIQESSGEYIFILGAHSLIDENYANNCLQVFNRYNDISCAGGPINSIGKTGLGKSIALAMSSSIGVGNAKHRFPDYEGLAEMACFPVYKREVFTKIGLLDENLKRNQDDDLSFRLRLSGGKVYLTAKAKSYYYVRENISKLFIQYFQYGYWRIALLKKHAKKIALRQQIPFLFFLSVFSLIALSFLFENLLLGAVLPIIYLFILISHTIFQFIKMKKIFVFWLPVVIITLHFAYASGFLCGILFSIKKKM